MSDISGVSTEELQRLQKRARELAHSTKVKAGSFSNAYDDRAKDWFRYCDELKRRGVKPEE